MKKLLYSTLCSIAFLSFDEAIAQDWNTGGNNALPGAVLGTNNNQPLRIITSAIERYRITPIGSFQWFGSTATGLRSMALGDNTTASGENAFSGGVNSEATALNSFSFGFNNQSTNFGAVTFGNNNVASGQNAVAFGFNNQSTNFGAVTFGNNNVASGDNAVAFGSGSESSGDGSFSFGNGSNTASGSGSFAFGPQFTVASGIGSFAGGFDVFSSSIGTFAFGENVTVSGAFATAIGQGLQATGNNSLTLGVLSQSNGAGSVAIGHRVRANDQGSFALGYSDTTTGWFLNNNIQRSLMVGFNSDVSTFFVGESNGQGTTGNVGIGELAAMGGQPQNKLEITSDGNSPTSSGLRFTNLTSAATPIVNPGNGLLSVNPDGDVIYVEAAVGPVGPIGPAGPVGPIGPVGPVGPGLNANNGIFINGGVIRLGAPCNNLIGLLSTQFTESRTVLNRNHNFWIASLNNETGGVGFGGQPASVPFCGTGNTVEISANNNNLKYGNTDASGLRFTKLTSLSPTIANGVNGVDNTKVLSVDEDGDVVYVDVPIGGADDQNLTNAVLNGTILTIDIEDGNSVSVDLSNLQDGTGTDDQNLTNATLIGTILTIDIEDGNSVSVDLSNLQDGTGTDDQNLTNATLIGSILTIDIENGNSVSVDLSNLVTTATVSAHNGTSISTIDPDFVSFGQDIGDINNPGILLSNREIPMDGFNIEFNGIGIDDGNLVSFGQPNTSTGYLDGKVHVFNNHQSVALTGYTDAAALVPFVTEQYGISGYIINAESDLSAGVHGLAENSAPGMQGTGVFGEARNNFQNIAVRGTVFDDNSDVNFGGNFFAGGTAQTNYGIFCGASGATGTNWAGLFTGPIFAGGMQFGSDSLIKDNVQNLTNATSLLNQLNPVTFDYKQNNEFERLNFSEENQFGLIAQDVESFLPELVMDVTTPAEYDSTGNEVYPALTFKGLNYNAFIPILIKGFQEQNQLVDSLSNELAQKDSLINDVNDRLTLLENCLSNLLPLLCQINNSAIQENDEETQSELFHTLNLELNDGENIVLEQNIPNPFAERTVINYFLPESVNDAKIIFYSQEGRMINEMRITERGNGRVNVFGADLSKGIYSYTLICDGQVIATKKMVKQ